MTDLYSLYPLDGPIEPYLQTHPRFLRRAQVYFEWLKEDERFRHNGSDEQIKISRKYTLESISSWGEKDNEAFQSWWQSLSLDASFDIINGIGWGVFDFAYGFSQIFQC